MEYIEELYGRNELETSVIEEEEELEEDEEGDTVLRSEFNTALKEFNGTKTPGIDGIPAELLRSAGEEIIDRLYKLVCNIYKKGEVSSDFKKPVIVTIPKNVGADKLEEYSLTTDASKILTRILYRIIERRAKEM